MDQIGPYRLVRPLGEGGMGVVWRAEHVDTGKPVALKTVRLLHAKQLDGLRREVRALSRISHPGIVRILDQGLHNGVPWYAMELLEGPSLRQRARTLTSSPTTPFLHSNRLHFSPKTTVPLDLPESPLGEETWDDEEPPPEAPRLQAANGHLPAILSLVRALCDPLAFLHGEGIVHRDLKPENVVVLPPGRPVIVDFGLVSQGAAGRETLSVDSVLHGTASYMGPEQIRGELADARADLYALGVILYELVTGRLPFVGNSVGATLYQTLQRIPLAPSQRVDGVPEGLDELILALLAKRQEDRPGYATDVAEVLERLGAERPAHPVPEARAYLYRPRFSGRSRAVRTLQASLELGRGVVLLGGESGVGKTRLALEFARTAATRGRTVLVGECQATDRADARAAPLHPLRAALLAVADQCMQGVPGTVDRILGDRGRVLGRYQPALLSVPGVSAQPEPERLEPEAEGLRTMHWIATTLAAMGPAPGTVLLLDDLEWADAMTLDWLGYLARSDQEGLLVVGTHGLQDLPQELADLRNTPGVAAVSLKTLDREAVRSMAEDMLASQRIPDGLVDFLTASSDGNPLLVAEYLRAAVTTGALARRDFRWRLASDPDSEAWSDLPVPRKLEDLVLQRIEHLGPLATHALQVAVVAGGVLQPERIARIADPSAASDAGDWLDAISELLDAAVVESVDHRVRLIHDRVRDVVYQDLPAARRATLHGAVASDLEAWDPTDAGAIGNHWLAAGDPTRATRWLLVAADRALEQVAFTDAERMLRTLIAIDDLPPADQVRVRIALGGRVLSTLGRNAEALEVLEQARAGAQGFADRGPLADAIAALGDVAATVGRLADALVLHREALALRRDLGDPGPTARALLRVAGGLTARGAATDARPLADEALDLARVTGDPVLEGEVLLARAALDPEDRAGAITLLEAAKQRFDTAGARLHQARVLERLARLTAGATALSLYQQALALYRAIGERVRMGRVLSQIAQALHAEGRAGESYASFAEALQVFREAGHHRFQGHTLYGLGLHLRLDGRLDEALGLTRQALTLLTVVGDRPWLLKTRLELARIALLRGEPAQAAPHALKATGLADALENRPARTEAIHLHALALEALGELDQALALHRRARLSGRPDLAARARVWEARIERLQGGDPDLLDARLHAALAELQHVSSQLARTVAWCELGHLALRRGQSSDAAWMAAQDAHHEPLRLDPLGALHLAELQRARSPR